MQWIHLEGAVNVRDVGGLRTADGSVTAGKRLLRSDNLQDLTPADIVRLVDEFGLTRVIDMRTESESQAEGPTPLQAVEAVEHVQHSVIRIWLDDPDPAVGEEVLLARQAHEARLPGSTPDDHTAGHYLGYLEDRPESVVAALRAVADTPGAALVHCAAGKDRTGVIVALALVSVGVPVEDVAADYAATADRIEAILARLRSSATYATGIDKRTVDEHTPKASAMLRFLEVIGERYGGVEQWLAAQGFTEADQAALRTKLLA